MKKKILILLAILVLLIALLAVYFNKKNNELVNVAYETKDFCKEDTKCTKEELVKISKNKKLKIEVKQDKDEFDNFYATLSVDNKEYVGYPFGIEEFGVLNSKYFVTVTSMDLLETTYYDIESKEQIKKMYVSEDYSVLDTEFDYYTCSGTDSENQKKNIYHMTIDKNGEFQSEFVKSIDEYCSPQVD